MPAARHAPRCVLRRRAAALCLLLVVALAGGCTAVVRHAVPREEAESARPAGMPSRVRFWGDREDPTLALEIAAAAAQAGEGAADVSALVLSGGGDAGAFGAGILCGWSKRGDRPRFRTVTGTSTGALIAPLAFLGPRYDARLKEAYTTVGREDILRVRALFNWLRYDSIADSRPLQDLAARMITDEALREIAAEHAAGRRLYLQTVNLDAQRPVIWDMGAIAASGRPDAAALFRQVMIASASIPGIFPPQYIRVESNGRTCDEMHVDGSTMSQATMNAVAVDMAALCGRRAKGGPRRARVYAIRNGSVRPQWQAMTPRLLPIAERALLTMTQSQAESELDLIYYRARETRVDFRVSFLPETYVRRVQEEFNREEMNRMFSIGYDLARRGNPWQSAPLRYAEPPRPTPP